MFFIELQGDPEGQFAIRVLREPVRRGHVLLCRQGFDTLGLDPSLTMDQDDIKDFLAVSEAVLTDMSRREAG